MENRELFDLLGLLIFLTSLIFSIIFISPKKISQFSSLSRFLPLIFLLVVALYVLPLSLFDFSLARPSGDISPNLDSFSRYIPIALILSSVFNLVFAFCYRKFFLQKTSLPNINEPRKLSNPELIIVYGIFILSIWLLYQLSKEVGGLLGLILSGYRVTELFINKGHYAVGFEWIITLSLLLWGNALITKNRKKILSILILLLVVSASFAIMGRRAALVILLASSIFLYHQLYRPIKLYKLIVLGIAGFYFLTLIGFLRGDSYENISSLMTKVQEKKVRIEDEKSVNLFYTITTGNFAVPFETFPQIIKSFGDKYSPGLGSYSLRSLVIIVPSAIWTDRPLPLANWYMNTYYGNTPLNEGRQFFLLTQPYMDFGPAGIFIFGLFYALFYGFILKIGTINKYDVLNTVFITLIITNTLNIVSSDFSGWLVAFIKGYGFPVIILYIIRLFDRFKTLETTRT